MLLWPTRLQDVEVITFDCYGTLIDWQGGAKATLRELLEKEGGKAPFDSAQGEQGLALPEHSLDEFFQAWERAQWRRIQGPYRRYREIVAESFAEVVAAQRWPLPTDAGRAFADSIATWKPFPDVPKALAALKRRLRLGIISNIDDDLLAASVEQLGIGFDLLITAQQARAYKPSPVPFERALERLGLPAARVAHAAFGFEYDIGPASGLGFRTILVRRTGTGFPAAPIPDLQVADLAELAVRFG